MLVALWYRRPAGIGILVDDAFAHCEHAIIHRDIDELALPRSSRMVERGEDAEGGQGRRENVADPWADLHRRRCIGASDTHGSTHGLRHDIECGPVNVRARPGSRIAEAANGGVDELWVIFGEILVSDPKSVHYAGTEVLDDDVGAPNQSRNRAFPSSDLRSSAMLFLLRFVLWKYPPK